jgi:hypothetical protein
VDFECFFGPNRRPELARFLLWLPSTVASPSHFPGANLSGRAPERRNHHRVLVGAPAWLLVDDDERYGAECVDVSMGGAAVRSEAAIRTGSVVRFELALGKDRGSVSIQCEVVRASDAQLGLRFLALDRASLEAILSLL